MKINKSLHTLSLSVFFMVSAARGVLAQDATYGGVATIGWFIPMIQNVLTVAITLAGIATFVMLLSGGIKVLTSGGNPESLESGKKTISTAIGGLILAVLAWFILEIISKMTGVDSLTTFSIPTLPL